MLPQASLDRLRVFEVVARTLSYSRAAEELVLSQPAVSKQVHALERELGVELLGQTGRRVYLTDAGRIAYDYARRVTALTAELARALDDLAHLDRGYLRIGASSTPGAYLLPAALAAYRAWYPAVDLDVRIANSREVEEAVLRGELDVGLVGARFVAGLQVRSWVQDRLVLIVPPHHRFASDAPGAPAQPVQPVAAAALAHELFVLREAGSGTRRTLEEALAAAGVTLGQTLELAGCEAVKQAVVAGLGVAAVSRFSVTCELAAGHVRAIPIAGLGLERALHVVTPKGVRASAAVLAFLTLLQKLPPPAA